MFNPSGTLTKLLEVGMVRSFALLVGLLALAATITACADTRAPESSSGATDAGTRAPERGMPDDRDSARGSAGSQGLVPAGPGADSTILLAVEGEGLRLFDASSGSSRPLPFGLSEAEVMRIVTRALEAEPYETGGNVECGVRYANWAEGITLRFTTRDGFVGWSLRDGSRFTTASGIGLGSTRAELESSYDAEVFASSIGEEFVAGGMAGILDSPSPDARVQHLWAGVSCIAR